MNKFYLVIWFFVGVVTLVTGEVTAVAYGCLWLFVMMYFLIKILSEGDRNNESE